MDIFWQWVAWKLPHRLAYWATLRLAAYATQGKYSDSVVPCVTIMEALKRWDET